VEQQVMEGNVESATKPGKKEQTIVVAAAVGTTIVVAGEQH